MRVWPLIVLLLSPALCSAIVIVPPLVYVASLSMLAVFLKLLVAFFSWLAVSGLASRGFLKRSAVSALSIFLSSASRLLLAFGLAVIFSLAVRPVEPAGVLLVSALTASVSAAVVFLSEFRRIRNTEDKIPSVAGLAAFGFLIFIICYASVWTSIEETVHVGAKKAVIGPVSDKGGAALDVGRVPGNLTARGAGT